MSIAEDYVAAAAADIPKSAANYLQPRHFKTFVAGGASNRRLLSTICNKVINGMVPKDVSCLIYDHKLVALSRPSKHQEDLEKRVRAALGGEGEDHVKVRPIAIGDALLRLAERAYCKQQEKRFEKFFMPYQVGVAVPGGLSMWASVVEALLQQDEDNVMLSIDLSNCFNALDRNELIAECFRHELTRPLAHYVAMTYPPSTIAWNKVENSWRAINFEMGVA